MIATQWECTDTGSSTTCIVTATSSEETVVASTTVADQLNANETLFLFCVLLFFVSMFSWRYVFHPFSPKV